MSRIRLTRKPDSETISSTLPNSDGWKRKNPISTQAEAPRVAVATASTNSSDTSSSP
jgi:hypothetical protein